MILENYSYKKYVSLWLISLLTFLLVIIVVGGLTRLTDSGLSITRWELFTGILPPLTNESWQQVFSLYKEIPQYNLLFPTMTLSEFKVIYYWEYIHRILGRVFGLLFLIPFIIFLIKGVFKKEFVIKFFILFLLILLQGFIGWYMVKSGLVENTTVSHYRLAIHLNIALILFASIFWYFLNIKNNQNKYFFEFFKNGSLIKFFVLLIFIQITLGAFTSGLDAGQIYQTWPSMNNNFFPDDIILSNLLNSDFFSDPSIVQFLHRNMAYIIFIYILGLTFYIFSKKMKYLYTPLTYVLVMVCVQIFLGIITLVSGLNIVYASLHQVSTTLLLITSINLSFAFKKEEFVIDTENKNL